MFFKKIIQKPTWCILTLIIVNICSIGALLIVVILSGTDYHELLLRDDGYYNIAKSFVHGGNLMHRFRGPVLPLIFSTLFLFPDKWHSILRLVISLMVSIAVICISYQIAKNYLNLRQFLIGGLLFILNPIYIHWTFKSSPEIYLSLCLGLFILNILKYYKWHKIKCLIYATVAFVISFFIKPTFLFIPIVMLIAACIWVKSKEIIVVSFLYIVMGIVSFVACDKFTQIKYEPSTKLIQRKYAYVHKIFLITDSFWTDYVLKTRQFHKGTVHRYKIPYKEGKSLYECKYEWLEHFFRKYPDANLLFTNLYFIYDKPWLVVQKLLVSPIFYFSMSARTYETFLKLIFNAIALFFVMWGIKILYRQKYVRKELTLILSIVAGYIILHLLTHAMNRYALPILPYLFVFGGVSLANIRWRTR